MTRQGPVMLIRVMLTGRECTFLGGGDRVQTYTTSAAYVHCPLLKWLDDEYYTQSLFYLALKVNIAAWKRISSRISTNQVVASWLSVNTISAKGSELNAVCRCVIEIYQIYIFIPPHKAVTRSTWLDISLFGLLVRLKTHLGTSQLLGNSQHKIYEKNRAEQNETSPRTMNGQKLPHTPVHL